MPVIFSLFVFLLLALAPVPALAADACIDLGQKAAELERRAVKSDDSNDAALLGYFYYLQANAAWIAEQRRDNYKLGQKDAEQATKWLRRAADQNNANAQYWLARLYKRGEGVKQDITEYVRFMRLAAEQGLSDAQSDLGDYYSQYLEFTRGNVDIPQAGAWHRKAAAQGNLGSIISLGRFYTGVRGWEKSEAESLFWYKLVQKLDSNWWGITEHVKRLELQVTDTERAEIDARVEAWVAKPSAATIASQHFKAAVLEMEKWGTQQCPPAPPPNPKKKKGPA